jgi:hypothetical protein
MSVLGDQVWTGVWFGVTGLIGWSGWRAASQLFPAEAASVRVGHAVVLGWAQVVLAAMAIGMTGLLAAGSLLVAGTVVALLTQVLVTMVRRPHHGGGTPPLAGNRHGRGWPLLWAAVFAAAAGHIVVHGLLRFPEDWDTLMYHLPLVNHWLQAGSLYAPDDLRWSDPGNNELIALWVVAPFSGDFLYALNNLPAAVLLAWGAYQLAHQVGVTGPWCHLGALAVVSNFVVVKQLGDAENDVAVAGLLLSGLAYGLRYAAGGRRTDLGFGAVCLGLLAGVKYYALGYVAVAAVLLVFLVARQRGLRAAAGAAGVGAAGILLFGGYWYARNWVCGGSPVHPLGAPAGADLATRYPAVWRTTFLGNGSPEVPGLAVTAVWSLVGPVYLAALLTLPATVVSGVWRRSPQRPACLTLAAATVGSLMVLLVTPFAVEDVPGTLNQMHWKYCPVRYGLCSLSLSVLTLVAAVDRVSNVRWRRAEMVSGRPASVAAVVFSVGVAYQLWLACQPGWGEEGIDVGLIATTGILLAVNLGWFAPACGRARSVAGTIAVLIGMVGVVAAVGVLSARWHAGYAPFYDRMLGRGLFAHMGQQLPHGSAVYVLDLRAYPFFGSSRQFRVCQTSPQSSCDDWVGYIRSRRVVVVAARFDLSHDWRSWRAMHAWLADHPDEFVPAVDMPWPYAVYWVVRDGLARLETPSATPRGVDLLYLIRPADCKYHVAWAESNDEGRVVELKLHGRRVGDRAFDHVKELSELKSLSLYGSAVTDDGLAKLKGLPRLEALGSGKTGVARAGLAHLERLPAVRWVWVTESKTLTPAQVEDFKKKAVPGITVYQ